MSTASGQFQFPNSGRFTRLDLTGQDGPVDEIAVDAFFGIPMLGGGIRLVRPRDATLQRARRPHPWLATGGQKTGVVVAQEITRPLQVISGKWRPRRGSITFTRGAARISSSDPLTRPLLLVRGPAFTAKIRQRLQPVIGKPARLGDTDPKTRPIRPLIGWRLRVRGQVILTRGAAKISSTDPRTTPALVKLGPPNVARLRWRPKPWLAANPKEPGLTTDRPPLRTRPVSGLAPRRAVRPPWFSKPVKDTPVVATDRSRPALVVLAPQRRRGTLQPVLSTPRRLGDTDPRLAPKLRLVSPTPRKRAVLQPQFGKPRRLGDTDARLTRPLRPPQAPPRRQLPRQPRLLGATKVAPILVPRTWHLLLAQAAPTKHRRFRGTVWRARQGFSFPVHYQVAVSSLLRDATLGASALREARPVASALRAAPSGASALRETRVASSRLNPPVTGSSEVR